MCLHTFTSPARLLESANETLRETGDQRSLRLVPSLAMNINFFLHSLPIAPPDTPPDTKENQLSVCVSDYREVVHGSFTQPLLPQGHSQTLHVGGWIHVQKLSKSRK